MTVRVFPHRLKRPADIGIIMKPGGERDPQRGEPRGREIDHIVDFRGGLAERLVARRVMADHAVGGVDRLVADHAGRPRSTPRNWRHDTVGEILGEAFNGRARHAGFIEDARIAAEQSWPPLSPGFEPIRIERIGNGGDVLVEALLRDERAGEAGKDDERDRARQLAARR